LLFSSVASLSPVLELLERFELSAVRVVQFIQSWVESLHRPWPENFP
jgi:hypothetical protein